MKRKKAKGSGRSAERKWATIRITNAEKLRLSNQAHLAGLSLSEYLRRNFFGGKPLVAHTDLKIIMELRRIGGLLKFNFTMLREAHAPYATYAKLNEASDELVKLLNKLAWLFDDSKKD